MTKQRSMFLIFGLVAVCALSMGWLSNALATCEPDPASAGQTVTCDSAPTDDADGFDADGVDSLTVVVEAGSSVTNDDEAIILEFDSELTVDGEVESTGDKGVEVEGDNTITVNEGGSIEGADQGIDANEPGNVITVHGTVTGNGDHAIQTDDDTDVTVSEDGTVTSFDSDGINVNTDNGGDNTITVNGTVNGWSDGIQTEDAYSIMIGEDGVVEGGLDPGDDGDGIKAEEDDDDGGDNIVVVNDGLVKGDDDGIQVGDNANITNNGRIEAEDEGVNATDPGDNLTLLNNGEIITSDDAIGTNLNADIDNYGLIDGGDDGIDIDTGTVDNWGTIIARGVVVDDEGAAIDFDEQDGLTSVIRNYRGAVMRGYYGILEDPSAGDSTQVVYNNGLIEGEGGVAIQLEDNSDTVYLQDVGVVIGLIDGGEDDNAVVSFMTIDYSFGNPVANDSDTLVFQHEICDEEHFNSVQEQLAAADGDESYNSIEIEEVFFEWVNFENIVNETTFSEDCDDDDDGGGGAGVAAAPGVPAAPVGATQGFCNIIGSPARGFTGSDSGGDAFCRVINENGTFVTNPAEIGNTDVLNRGVLQAVDVFSFDDDGNPKVPFAGQVRICLRGSGQILFLNAATFDRALQGLEAVSEGGYTCAFLPNAGTIVLVPGAPAPSANPAPADDTAADTTTTAGSVALDDCRVTTTFAVRGRSTPETTPDNVVTTLPFDLTLEATAFVPGWLRVIYLDGQVWVDEQYLETAGNCGN